MQPHETDEDSATDEADNQAGDCDNIKARPDHSVKMLKPIMEKRRRARINKSLNELKSILLGALKRETTQHSKWEKADILEMTVKYVKKLNCQKATALKIDPAVMNKYKAGFNECRNEVMKFLSTHEGVSVEVRTLLLSHLASCQQSLKDERDINSLNDVSVDEIIPYDEDIAGINPILFRPKARQKNYLPPPKSNGKEKIPDVRFSPPASQASCTDFNPSRRNAFIVPDSSVSSVCSYSSPEELNVQHGSFEKSISGKQHNLASSDKEVDIVVEYTGGSIRKRKKNMETVTATEPQLSGDFKVCNELGYQFPVSSDHTNAYRTNSELLYRESDFANYAGMKNDSNSSKGDSISHMQTKCYVPTARAYESSAIYKENYLTYRIACSHKTYNNSSTHPWRPWCIESL